MTGEIRAWSGRREKPFRVRMFDEPRSPWSGRYALRMAMEERDSYGAIRLEVEVDGCVWEWEQ